MRLRYLLYSQGSQAQFLICLVYMYLTHLFIVLVCTLASRVYASTNCAYLGKDARSGLEIGRLAPWRWWVKVVDSPSVYYPRKITASWSLAVIGALLVHQMWEKQTQIKGL